MSEMETWGFHVYTYAYFKDGYLIYHVNAHTSVCMHM